MEKDIFPDLAKNNSLKAVPFAEPFIDIGIPDDYAKAQTLIPIWKKQKRYQGLFIDRDGIIVKDNKHTNTFTEADIYADALSFLRKVKNRKIIIVSNQSAVAKGITTIKAVNQANAFLVKVLKKKGVEIDGVYCCPFHEEGTVMAYKKKSLQRKPEPGMLLKAAEEHGIDLYRAIMIGDQDTDIIRLPYLKSYLIQRDYVIRTKSLIENFSRIFP